MNHNNVHGRPWLACTTGPSHANVAPVNLFHVFWHHYGTKERCIKNAEIGTRGFHVGSLAMATAAVERP